jgi:8-oxo-dGTP pyrophosphatase MutT (NUDIX family)
MVLVSDDGARWWLPGGGREAREETLAREVAEEVCAEVVRCAYLGCTRFDDPDRPEGPTTEYHARCWARVALRPFEPQFEIGARRLVPSHEFLAALFWGSDPTTAAILDRALEAERAYRDGR